MSPEITQHLFIAGVPATGKSWLGSWLAEQFGYLHIDAERENGADFDRSGLRPEWNCLINTGRATALVTAAVRKNLKLALNWGFPTRFLYVASALQAEGVTCWWLHARRDIARRAFVQRGGINSQLYDDQMDDIEREWLLISSVFNGRIITALCEDGTQRVPGELWSDIRAAG